MHQVKQCGLCRQVLSLLQKSVTLNSVVSFFTDSKSTCRDLKLAQAAVHISKTLTSFSVSTVRPSSLKTSLSPEENAGS